jgi:hypothetical protein
LQSGAVYEFQVQTVCASTNGAAVTSPWSQSVFYTAPAAISVYPNPSGDLAQISFETTDAGSALLEIMDHTGNIIYTSTLATISGTNISEINTTGFRDGFYQVRITTPQFSGIQKLLIRH